MNEKKTYTFVIRTAFIYYQIQGRPVGDYIDTKVKIINSKSILEALFRLKNSGYFILGQSQILSIDGTEFDHDLFDPELQKLKKMSLPIYLVKTKSIVENVNLNFFINYN